MLIMSNETPGGSLMVSSRVLALTDAFRSRTQFQATLDLDLWNASLLRLYNAGICSA